MSEKVSGMETIVIPDGMESDVDADGVIVFRKKRSPIVPVNEPAVIPAPVIIPIPDDPARREAIDLIERTQRVLLKRGWTRGMYRSPSGAYCLIAAMRKAQSKVRASPTGVHTATESIHSVAGNGSIVNWNDHAAGSKAEVLLMLDRAKKTLSGDADNGFGR